MNNNASTSSMEQNASSLIYSDNEQSIILIGPTAQQYVHSTPSTWSRSAHLESVDLTTENNVEDDFDCDSHDNKIRRMLSKNYTIESYLKKLECPVCMESFLSLIKQGNKIMSTLCGHVFCQSCLYNSVKSSRKCPACREIVCLNTPTKQYSHRLYLPISLVKNT